VLVGRKTVRMRSGWLLALTLCAFLLALWGLSGIAITSTVCRGTQQLTPYRGPLSSLCLRLLLSSSADQRELI
jgi:hypothetical protein